MKKKGKPRGSSKTRAASRRAAHSDAWPAPSPVLEFIRQEVGHKEPESYTFRLGQFCLSDIPRSKNATDQIEVMVEKAKSLVGRRIIRVSIDPTKGYEQFHDSYDINLHLD